MKVSYRTIVDQSDVHHSLKNAILHFRSGIQCLNPREKVLVQQFGLFWLCCSVEIGFVPLPSIGQECELGH